MARLALPAPGVVRAPADAVSVLYADRPSTPTPPAWTPHVDASASPTSPDARRAAGGQAHGDLTPLPPVGDGGEGRGAPRRHHAVELPPLRPSASASIQVFDSARAGAAPASQARSAPLLRRGLPSVASSTVLGEPLVRRPEMASMVMTSNILSSYLGHDHALHPVGFS